MNVKIGTVAEQFLFWDYLFRIFDVVSLQCEIFDFRFFPESVSPKPLSIPIGNKIKCTNGEIFDQIS
jgi:hypothetical protein